MVDVSRVVTPGFLADGRTPVENNVWLIGDEREVLVVDAAHDANAIAAAVGVRRVVAIVCTHAHQDHVNAAQSLAQQVNAGVWLHQSDLDLWQVVHPGTEPDDHIEDGSVFDVGGVSLRALHTPGHTRGSVCLHAPELGVLFSGDTLFPGGPGATRDPTASFPTIIESIREQLFTLPPATVVHTGHGESTTIGAETPQLPEWVARGW